MKTRLILAAAAACAAIVMPAFGQQAEDAEASLNESSKAMQAVPGLTFEGKKFGTGMLKEIINCEGKVKLWHPAPGKDPMILVTGKIKQTRRGRQEPHVHVRRHDRAVARGEEQHRSTALGHRLARRRSSASSSRSCPRSTPPSSPSARCSAWRS